MRWRITLIGLLLLVSSPASAISKTPTCRSHPGLLHCFAKVARDPFGHPLISTSPSGYGPSEWRHAYGVPGPSAPRIGIVVAFGDITLLSDMERYSATFGLPSLSACRSISQAGCLDLRTQDGNYGAAGGDSGWAMETALDAETIHGICARCRIEVVAASSASNQDLLAAVDRAIALGSTVISMSWGGREFASEVDLDSHFTATGVTFVASSGDSGYGTSWPAVSPHILAVGGTSLSFSSSGAIETAWIGSGSGCSHYEAKPIWQTDIICKNRTMADISADADPLSGAAVFRGVWYRVGGTSLAAPIVAGFAASHGGVSAARVYRLAGLLRDISVGANGKCSQIKAYLCNARVGYDGPTGLGSLTGRFAW